MKLDAGMHPDTGKWGMKQLKSVKDK